MVLQTLLLRRNFPCPHFFGLGEGPEFDILRTYKTTAPDASSGRESGP